KLLRSPNEFRNQRMKSFKGADRTHGQPRLLDSDFNSAPNGSAALNGKLFQYIGCGFPDASRRRIAHPEQVSRIVRTERHGEIADQVLDFGAFVTAEAAHDPILHVVPA